MTTRHPTAAPHVLGSGFSDLQESRFLYCTHRLFEISIYFLFARPNKKYTNYIDIRFFLSLHEKFLPHTVQHLDVNRCQRLFCCVVAVALTWKRIIASLWTKYVKWKLSKRKQRSLNCTATIEMKSSYDNGGHVSENHSTGQNMFFHETKLTYEIHSWTFLVHPLLHCYIPI